MGLFPRLSNMLGAWLHQDRHIEGPSIEGVIDAFVGHVGQSSALQVADEIDRLLGSGMSESGLSEFVKEPTGYGYDPSGDEVTTREWLQYVARGLRLRAGD